MAQEKAYINIVGPTQVGKSIVLNAIADLLENKFGCKLVASAELRNEGNVANLDWDNGLDDWEKDMVRNTCWILKENNETFPTNVRSSDVSYFPLVVEWSASGDRELIHDPKELEGGVGFRILATQVRTTKL